jgi:hypothetical protein
VHELRLGEAASSARPRPVGLGHAQRAGHLRLDHGTPAPRGGDAPRGVLELHREMAGVEAQPIQSGASRRGTRDAWATVSIVAAGLGLERDADALAVSLVQALELLGDRLERLAAGGGGLGVPLVPPAQGQRGDRPSSTSSGSRAASSRASSIV